MTKWNSFNNLFKKCKSLNNFQIRNFKHEATELFLKQEGTKTHGDLHIVPLSSKYINGTWNLLNDVFFKEEPTCKFIGISNYVEAKTELRPIFTWIMEEGISMVVTDRKTDKVVAANLNKIWVPEDYEFLNQHKQACVHPASIAYLQEFIDVDIFKLCDVTNIFEIFVGASSEITRRTGLTREMFALSVRLADHLSRMKQEDTVNQEFNYPEAVAAVLAPTSTRGQQLGLLNNVEVHMTVKYEDKEMEFTNMLAYAHLPLVANTSAQS